MLITQIKKDRMQARVQENQHKYETLTTLLSEIQRLEKPDQENDDKVQGVCKKYIKGINEMISVVLGGKPQEATEADSMTDTTEQSPEDIKATMLLAEKITVEQYLPKQLNEGELENAIQVALIKAEATTMKDMGKVMKELKANFDGLYDGKIASQRIRELLNS